jgi:hypothetical protein
MSTPAPEQKPTKSFADEAKEASPGIMGELMYFLRHNKKWWLTPIIVVLLLLAALIILGGTGAAPFIYTLF